MESDKRVMHDSSSGGKVQEIADLPIGRWPTDCPGLTTRVLTLKSMLELPIPVAKMHRVNFAARSAKGKSLPYSGGLWYILPMEAPWGPTF